jgi:hypothetical protein
MTEVALMLSHLAIRARQMATETSQTVSLGRGVDVEPIEGGELAAAVAVEVHVGGVSRARDVDVGVCVGGRRFTASAWTSSWAMRKKFGWLTEAQERSLV